MLCNKNYSIALLLHRRVDHKHAKPFLRLATLEARASKRSNLMLTMYLPAVFLAYGILLGTVYFQQTAPVLVMSGFCVYSVASALFMFPILFNYYHIALEVINAYISWYYLYKIIFTNASVIIFQVYRYEHADGIGNSADLVIQGFIRMTSIALLPVVVCAGILYLLV